VASGGQLAAHRVTHRERETGDVAVRYKTFDQLEFLCQ
jgi:hypothetical protein